LTKIELLHGILLLKHLHREHRKNIDDCKTKTTTYKGKPIKITADFSTEILKAIRAWKEVF
jgi:hypothetical protein